MLSFLKRNAGLLLKSILACGLILAACSGGVGGGGTPGGGELGNWAAGPMSIPAPASVNKSLIYCDNITGPEVACYGKPGAVDPGAKVTITVKPIGYTWMDIWEILWASRAYAVPGFTAFGMADGAGAFGPIKVLAVEKEVLEIQSCIAQGCSHKLLLKVPAEGGSVSGSTGTMKNLQIDPGSGDGFHSRRQDKPSWDWTSLFIASAQASPSTYVLPPESVQFQVQLPPVPTYNATCTEQPASWATLPRALEKDPGCYVMRVKASSPDVSERYMAIPGCESQDDIQVIRLFKGNADNKNHLAVGVKNWLYLIKVDAAAPPQILRRIAFPYEVHDVFSVENHLLVFLGGENIPNDARRFYTITNNADWEAACWGTNLSGALNGLKDIVSSDGSGGGFSFVGAYPSGTTTTYKVFHGSFTDWDLIDAGVYMIYQSTHPLEVAALPNTTKAHYAVLDKTDKKLVFIQWDKPWNGRGTATSQDYPLSTLTADGAAVSITEASNLVGDQERKELAFLDIMDERHSRIIVVPYTLGDGVYRILTQVATVALDYIPTVLARTDAGEQTGWTVNTPENRIRRFTTRTEAAEDDSDVGDLVLTPSLIEVVIPAPAPAPIR